MIEAPPLPGQACHLHQQDWAGRPGALRVGVVAEPLVNAPGRRVPPATIPRDRQAARLAVELFLADSARIPTCVRWTLPTPEGGYWPGATSTTQRNPIWPPQNPHSFCVAEAIG